MQTNEYAKERPWLGRIFSFHGRATRSEWWLVSLFQVGLLLLSGLVLVYGDGGDAVKGSGAQAFWALPAVLVFFMVLWLEFALNVRRLHDMNHSAVWGVLVTFIPIFLKMICCGILSGTRGANRFGPDPRDKKHD